MIICKSCGRSLQSGAKVCQGCGTKVPESDLNLIDPPSNKMAAPPPIKVPKAPIPSRKVEEEVKPTVHQELPKKSNSHLGKVLVLIIAVGVAGYWLWSAKQAEEQKTIEQARIAEEHRIEAERLAKEKEKLEKDLQIKAEQEKEVLRAQAEELKAQKEAALEAKRKAEEERKALEQAQLETQRKMQEQAKAAELEKARILRERQLASDRNRNNNVAPAPAPLAQPNQQQQAIVPPSQPITQDQEVADKKHHTAYFRGAFNMLIMKKRYPTEEMKNQALEIWKTKREILELDGTTSKPNQGNNNNPMMHN